MSGAAGDTGPVVLFDGVCNLCNGAVQWLIEHDPEGRLRYASLQWPSAEALLSRHLGPDEIDALPDSILLVDEAGVHTRSTAALRIAGRLGFPWRLGPLFLIVPRFIRDGIYDWVARNRYRWFGRREACMIPAPGVADRFLDDGGGESAGDGREAGDADQGDAGAAVE